MKGLLPTIGGTLNIIISNKETDYKLLNKIRIHKIKLIRMNEWIHKFINK